MLSALGVTLLALLIAFLPSGALYLFFLTEGKVNRVGRIRRQQRRATDAVNRVISEAHQQMDRYRPSRWTDW